MNNNANTVKKISVILITLLFLPFLLTGCSSIQVGHDFDVQLFNNQVKTRITTKAQVKNWLGEPTSTGISMDKDGDISEEWMYYHGTGTLSKMEKAKLKILQVRFDKNGVVISYNWSNAK